MVEKSKDSPPAKQPKPPSASNKPDGKPAGEKPMSDKPSLTSEKPAGPKVEQPQVQPKSKLTALLRKSTKDVGSHASTPGHGVEGGWLARNFNSVTVQGRANVALASIVFWTALILWVAKGTGKKSKGGEK
ncbi:hypothetical protein M8J75_014141 [Diaphorina citri]|nr:hypothetical protein M8J75_014141 [Diaphorina citri]